MDRPVFFSVFINSLDAELEGVLCLLMMLNWEELLISSKSERPCRDTLIEGWAITNNVKFNNSKCQILLFPDVW